MRLVWDACAGDGIGPGPAVVFGCLPDEELQGAQASAGDLLASVTTARMDKAAFERVAYDARLRSTRARTASYYPLTPIAYQKPALPLASTHSRDTAQPQQSL